MSRDDDDVDDDDLEMEDDDDQRIPDVDWAADIKKAEDNDKELFEKEIQKAEKIEEQIKKLNDQYERGEIDIGQHESIYIDRIKPLVRKARMSSALASVNLNSDDIGDLVEDRELLLADDGKLSALKDKIREKISALGSDQAQEEADRLLDAGIIGKDAHARISRLTRLHARHNK